jgi:hypothetical protein
MTLECMTLLDTIADYNKKFYRFLKGNKNYLHLCEKNIDTIYQGTAYSEYINSNQRYDNVRNTTEIFHRYRDSDTPISSYLASEYEAYIFVKDFDSPFEKTLEDIYEYTSEYYETNSWYSGANIYLVTTDCEEATDYARRLKSECMNNFYYISFKKDIADDFYSNLLNQIGKTTASLLINGLEKDLQTLRDF